jgi:hypothetical protein
MDLNDNLLFSPLFSLGQSRGCQKRGEDNRLSLIKGSPFVSLLSGSFLSIHFSLIVVTTLMFYDAYNDLATPAMSGN